jgi:8-oxo-dGTP pyrophosphatase MutT (NUDIX family)
MSLDNQHPFEDDTAERVGVILLDSNENLLVIEGGGGKLSLPKGCRHRGESEWDGAVRECYEETGIDVEDPKLPTKFLKTLPLRWGVYQVIRLRCPGYEIKVSVQEGESCRVFWVNPSSKWMRKNPNLNADLRFYIREKEDLWLRYAPLTQYTEHYVAAGCAPEPMFPEWASESLRMVKGDPKEVRRMKGRAKRTAWQAPRI